MLLNAHRREYPAVQEIFATPEPESTTSSSETESGFATGPAYLTQQINPLAPSNVWGVDLYAEAIRILLQ